MRICSRYQGVKQLTWRWNGSTYYGDGDEGGDDGDGDGGDGDEDGDDGDEDGDGDKNRKYKVWKA